MTTNKEKRQGKTGVWTFVLRTPDDKILALSEWGSNYIFNEKEWLELPVIDDNTKQP